MPRNAAPSGPSPGEFLQALRDPGRNLKEKYRGKPIELAERFGIKLPRKPVLVMIELGIITEEEAIARFGAIEPGLRELVEDVCLLLCKNAVAVANRGGGKAQSIYTPIPTPDGWTTMGALKKGDMVFDEIGVPCTVTKAYKVMQNRPCCEVVFNDGSSVIADEDHLWLTSTATSRHADRYATGTSTKPQQTRTSFASVKTTAEIRDTLTIKAGGGRRDFHHQIRNVLPLDLPEVDLPIEPYTLGLWLGDGSACSSQIAVGYGDESVIEEIRSRGSEVNVGHGHCNIANVMGLVTLLKAANVYKNKHVPNVYLRASKQQRLDLLAGLMDSDGTTRASSNNCQFDNTNERLADAVYELVMSLGWKATRSKRVGKLYGVEHKLVHRVSFRPTEQIFRNPRKAARLNFEVGQESRHLSRTIVDVRPVESVPVRCIEVDSESRLFLCGEQMVPTHNSYGVSFIEFYLWMILDFDALNLGGSELQADQVYQYLLGYLESDPFWLTLLRTDPQRERTYKENDAWVRVLTASQKSVRSPHAGGFRKGMTRGGVLVIDEEAEAEKDIVEAALPTINTARPSVSVRCSTFHNLEGSFQEVVDNHEEMGYKLYRWDIFDVAEKCECIDVCQSSEPCFREDHIEPYTDPDSGEETERLVHKAYCGGRAMYADGWIRMEEIITLWKRMRRNHSRWEVEAMGSRPSSAGFVIKDLVKFASNITDNPAHSLYVAGCPVTIGVDWGTGNGAVEVWQEQFGNKHVLLHADLLKDNNETQIIGSILGYAHQYRGDLLEIAADIGGGGNYMNKKLRDDHRMPVRDVNFAEMKENGVAAWNMFNEAGECVYPAEHSEFIHQTRNWKRKNGRIQKGNDHLCDAAICYFAKFIDQLGLKRTRVPARSFSTNGDMRSEGKQVSVRPSSTNPAGRRPRVPVVRTFRKSGRR